MVKQSKIELEPHGDGQCTLAEARDALVAEFGAAAPSLVTLKRASARGKLDAARVQSGPHSRVRFRYNEVKRIMMAGYIVPPIARLDEPSRHPSSPAPAEIDYERLADLVAARMLKQAPALAQVGALLDAAKDLAAARSMLMAKYDESHTARAELSRVRGQGASAGIDALEIARIQNALGRIEGMLQSMQRS